MHINNHPSLLPLDPPATGMALAPSGTSQPTSNALSEPAPAASGAGMAIPWMGIIALAVLAALSLAALRLRFSDAPTDDRPASWDNAGEAPLVVPRPSLLFRRSHHEKMHDQRYLSLILEAELESPRPSRAGKDGDEAPPARR